MVERVSFEENIVNLLRNTFNWCESEMWVIGFSAGGWLKEKVPYKLVKCKNYFIINLVHPINDIYLL